MKVSSQEEESRPDVRSDFGPRISSLVTRHLTFPPSQHFVIPLKSLKSLSLSLSLSLSFSLFLSLDDLLVSDLNRSNRFILIRCNEKIPNKKEEKYLHSLSILDLAVQRTADVAVD